MTKYPLTELAKEAARNIVEAWESNKKQFYEWRLNDGATLADMPIDRLGLESRYAESLRELAHYGLIQLTFIPRSNVAVRIELLLLQELKNAVASDFEVSDYFLTMNSVGTIVHGDLTLHPNANYQSAATISGDIDQRIRQEVPDELIRLLGEDFLQTQQDLKQAIDDLRTATESDRETKLGKVVSELGRCLEHGANAATLIPAIAFVGGILGHL